MRDDSTKLCECGCGQSTRLAPATMRSRGWVKGEPIRFVHGHSGHRPIYTMRSAPADRGYASSCAVWLGCKDEDGYGVVRVDRVKRRAHRVAYELAGCSIPDGRDLHHLCGVRECVNAEHLAPVSKAEHKRAHARIKPADVAAIRASKERGKDLAARYGISQGYVSMIRNGERGG